MILDWQSFGFGFFIGLLMSVALYTIVVWFVIAPKPDP